MSSRLPEILAANVRRIRDLRGLSQAELIKRAGKTTVAMVESGQRKWPRPESLEAIAEALGVSVPALLVDADRPQHPALTSFLSTGIAANRTVDEVLWLERCLFDDREPTQDTYHLLLLAYRSTKQKNNGARTASGEAAGQQ